MMIPIDAEHCVFSTLPQQNKPLAYLQFPSLLLDATNVSLSPILEYIVISSH